MPLGIEANGVQAGLIERGGDFLAQSLIDTGKTIEGALIRAQAFKQAREFGQALSQTDPSSDQWPQQAAYLTSQYPLAVQSGLAQKIMEPMAKSYTGFLAAKRADNTFGNSVALENLRSRHAMDRVEARPGATGALPINFNTDPLQGDVQPGQQQGIQGVLQDTFSTMKGDQPAQDASVLPAMGEIPDAARAMSDRSRRELRVLTDLSNENKAILSAGGPAKWNTKNSDSEVARRIREEDKANAPAPDLRESTVAPGVLLTKSGAPLIRTETGVVRPGGQYESQRLAQTQEAQTARLERAKQTDAARALDRQLKTFDTDLSEARRALKKYRDDQIKNTEDENLKQRVFAQEKVVTDLIAARNAKLGEYTDLLKAAVDTTNTPDERSATATKIMRDPATGKRYEVDPDSKKIIREVQ